LCTSCTTSCPNVANTGFAKTNNVQCCQNYANAVSFASKFVSDTETRLNGNVKVGVVRFANGGSIETVPPLTNSTSAIMEINTTAYTGGWTNTAAAISLCRTVLASGTNAKQILVLLTDGNPTACTGSVLGCNSSCTNCNDMALTGANTQATLAKNTVPNNITLIPVGVGSGISTTNLQNWGTGHFYLTVDNFNQLPSILVSLTDAVLCED
jgi:hypothetical protein